MQEVFPATYAIPRPRVSASVQARRNLSFLDLLQSTFSVFARHPLPMLAGVLICFAGAGVIGSLLYGVQIGEAVLRTGTHTGTTLRAYNLQMLVQAILGTFTFLFGRGAITWIALHSGDGTPITFRAAVRAALRRWKPLLASTLLYGGLITLGIAGLTLLLRELRLDASNVRGVRNNLDSVLYWTTTRAISLLPPDPGSPFTEWYAATRYNMARSVGNSSYFNFSQYESALRRVSGQALAAGLAATAFFFITETLLCLRTAAIFGAQGARGWLAWLRESLRVSKTNFWRVAAWRWSLRLLFVVLAVATLILPLALHLGLLMFEVRRALSAGNWLSHIAQSAHGVGTALISATLFAFAVAFEARMYAVLTRK